MQKKTFFYSIFLTFMMIFSVASFADVGFSGIVAGNLGLDWNIETAGKTKFHLPINASTTMQIDFGDSVILRAGAELNMPDLTNGNIFDGETEAKIKINEISLVFVKPAISLTNYFSIYMGRYENEGDDTFLQRHFGLEPIGSVLLKNKATLTSSTVRPYNELIGLSYMAHWLNTPTAFGGYLYVNSEKVTDTSNISDLINEFNANFDLRFAVALDYFTMDARAGICVPLKTRTPSGDRVILLVDTMYIHGGINMLIGSLYSHSIYMQAGLDNITICNKLPGDSFTIDKLSFMFEPRIYTKNFKYRLSVFNLSDRALEESLYLKDKLGIALTIFTDTIQGKSGNCTFGFHLIASTPMGMFDFFDTAKDNPLDLKINAFITPYVQIPAIGGTLDLMAEVGALNILSGISDIEIKLKLGYKRMF